MHTDRVLMVVHHSPEDAGRVGEILVSRGWACEYRLPLAGDDLPQDLAAYDAVAVFGGTMSANDDHLPGIRAELDWIPHVAESGLPLLGCCLGGQLIARALGGRVYRQPRGMWKVGYYPVYATRAGERVFPEPDQHFYSWHQDGFDLPAGADLLATGDELFPNQAFSFGNTVYGLQFHPETRSAMFTKWMASLPDFEKLPGAHARQRQIDDAMHYDVGVDAWLGAFLTHWLTAAAARPRAQEA